MGLAQASLFFGSGQRPEADRLNDFINAGWLADDGVIISSPLRDFTLYTFSNGGADMGLVALAQEESRTYERQLFVTQGGSIEPFSPIFTEMIATFRGPAN